MITIPNNGNKQQEMVTVLEWSTTMKRSVYSPSELFQLRKPSKEGSGYLYYNYHRDTYEKPRSIGIVPKIMTAGVETKSASKAAGNKVVSSYNELPANVRLHEVFTGNAGHGFSIVR